MIGIGAATVALCIAESVMMFSRVETGRRDESYLHTVHLFQCTVLVLMMNPV